MPVRTQPCYIIYIGIKQPWKPYGYMRFIPHAWGTVNTHSWGMVNTHAWGPTHTHEWVLKDSHSDPLPRVSDTVEQGYSIPLGGIHDDGAGGLRCWRVHLHEAEPFFMLNNIKNNKWQLFFFTNESLIFAISFKQRNTKLQPFIKIYHGEKKSLYVWKR